MWKDIDFWNILPVYQIDEYGNIRNSMRNKMRKSHYDKYGYLNIILYDVNGERKNFKIHRLVAKVYIPTQDDTLEINHIDGVKDNNHISNLEWVNCSENQIHARKHGLNRRNILSDDDIHTLVEMVLEGYSTHDILIHFNIGSKHTDPRFVQFVRRVHAIKTRQIYNDVIDEVTKKFNDYPIGSE